MSAKKGLRLFLGVLLGAVSGYGTAAGQEANDPRLEKVFADWKKRQERIPTVRYRVEGVIVRPKGSLTALVGGTAPVPPKDVASPIKRMVLLDFKKDRYRLELDEQDCDKQGNPIRTADKDVAYTGTELQNVNRLPPPKSALSSGTLIPPDLSPPFGGIAKGNMRKAAFEARYYPLFLGHGIVPLAGGDQIYPGHLNLEPDKELLYVHAAKLIQGGRFHLVLRTHSLSTVLVGFKELWIDPDRESAVTRMISYSGKMPDSDTVVEYQRTSGGWLPKSWVYTVYIGPESQRRTVFYERMRTEVAIAPPVSDADFRIDFKPGMLVGKDTFPEPTPADPIGAQQSRTTIYRIDDKGQWNEVTIVGGVEVNAWGWRLLWLGVTLSAILTGSLIFWRIRQRRKARRAAVSGTLG